MKVIDQKGFKFCPYIYTPRGVSPLYVFEIHNREIISSPNREIISSPGEAISTLALMMMRIVAPTLFTTKSKSGDDVAIYNPQRAMIELGHDQGAARF